MTIKIERKVNPYQVLISNWSGTLDVGSLRALKQAIYDFENPKLPEGTLVQLTGSSWPHPLVNSLQFIDARGGISQGPDAWDIYEDSTANFSVTVLGKVIPIEAD